VGWAGAPEAFPALLETLGHEDPVVQLSAAYALVRITGARLEEVVEVPPEAIDVADVEEPDVGEPKGLPLHRIVSDPRDRPSEGSPEKIAQASVDPDRWRAFFAAHDEFKPELRYRRGSPYSAALSAWELDALPLTPGERRTLQRELTVRTGQHVRFDPHDFVEVQEEAIAEWAKIARRSGGAAGTWSRPLAR
jgi:hypothetical protein